jgi:hypothetical protein
MECILKILDEREERFIKIHQDDNDDGEQQQHDSS